MKLVYGMAITVTMMMTTILLFEYLSKKGTALSIRCIFLVVFAFIEGMFLFSSLTNFLHGGYVTVIIAGFILAIMYVLFYGNKFSDMREVQNAYVRLDEYTYMLI